MIVKLQRPLGSSGPTPPALVYNEGRSRQWMLYMGDAELQRLLGDDLKGYFEAEVDAASNRPRIGRRVPDQAW